MKKTLSKVIGVVLTAALCLTSVPVSTYGQEIMAEGTVEALSAAQDEEALVVNSDDVPSVIEGDDAEVGTDIFDQEDISDGTDPEAGEDAGSNTLSGNDVSPTDEIREDEDITNDGYFYPNESGGPSITFIGRNNGKYRKLGYPNEGTVEGGLSVKAILDTYGMYDNIVGGMKVVSDIVFDPAKGEYIAGWKVAVDGVEDTFLNTDFTYTDTNTPYLVLPNKDYHFTAIGSKDIAGPGVYIESIPTVFYNGREHVISDENLSKQALKKKVNDLKLTVLCNGDLLIPGRDYTVKYKNNKEASLKMDDGNNGIYEQKYSEAEKNKWPQVIISGKGSYAGISATAYFDIYPYNFAKEEAHVNISGLGDSYAIKDGKVQSKIAPKITLQHEGLKKATLKEGRDYEVAIYKADKSGNGQWLLQKDFVANKLIPANSLKEAGQYLYTVRGRGNYCGVYCGQIGEAKDFRLSGSSTVILNPPICTSFTESYAPWQFRLKDDAIYDLSLMKINIGTPTVNHTLDNSKVYTAADFNISVSRKNGKKWETIPADCYEVYFKGKDFPYIRSVTDSNMTYIKNTNAADSEYTSKGCVKMAGTYTVTVKAKEYNSLGLVGTLTSKKKINLKGITPKNKQLKKKTIKYNGTNDFGPAYVTSGLPYDIVLNSKDALNNHFSTGTDPETGGKLSLYHRYVGEDIGAKVVYPYKEFNDRMPGTYTTTLVPVGGAIDHDKVVRVNYKRVGIKLKEAEAQSNPETHQPLFKVDMTGSENELNVNGTMPSKLKISFNGHDNTIYSYWMQYNGQAVTLYDQYHNSIEVKIRAYNNKQPGQGYIVIEGDGKVFKGKSSKYYFTISTKTAPATIPVIESTKASGVYGELYATMTPVAKNSKSVIPKKPKITLYQGYYKNEADYYDGKVTYGKVDPKYYQLVLTDLDTTNHNLFDVMVANGSKKGFNFAPSYLDKNYTLYDGKVDIDKIDVLYGGMTYTLSKKQTFNADFTGSSITPVVKTVYLSNGTALTDFDYTVSYGENRGAGTKKGTITITMRRNSEINTFKQGSKTFYFNIDPAPGVIL